MALFVSEDSYSFGQRSLGYTKPGPKRPCFADDRVLDVLAIEPPESRSPEQVHLLARLLAGISVIDRISEAQKLEIARCGRQLDLQ